MNFQKDLRELNISKGLTQKFKSLEGTRHIIQYEHPEYVFTLSKTFKPKVGAFGVTNRCSDGLFVLFLDYDKIYKQIMYKNLANLINRFPKCFDNFYIAKTEEEKVAGNNIKGSYHAVNFVKQYKYQINEFLKFCDVDPYFMKIPEKTAHKCHVLRISNKFWKINGQSIKEAPAFIEIYPETALRSNKESSHAHYKLFKKYWKLEDPFYAHKKFDKLTEVELHKFSTPKR